LITTHEHQVSLESGVPFETVAIKFPSRQSFETIDIDHMIIKFPSIESGVTF
jgi:hypothetical protein